MRKFLLALAALGLWAGQALAQSSQFNLTYPPGAAAVTATGTGTTAAAATLPARQGTTTYICSFSATEAGTTAGTVTITNTVSGSLNYVLSGTTPLVVNFLPCMPANASNTSIVVTGAFTGGTSSAINATGYAFPNP